MKRVVLVLACLLCCASPALAQQDVPNMRQSITYFMTAYNLASLQAAQIRERLEQDKKVPEHPYTAPAVFYTDLGDRIDKAMALYLNLCDLYFVYYKATYCFAKDEKSYLLSRIDAIEAALKQLTDRPLAVDVAGDDADKARMREAQTAFTEQVTKLRAFVTSSLPAFQR